jgi:hypothetical protein
MGDYDMRKLKDPSIDDDVATKTYVDNAVDRPPVITGILDMKLNNIISVREPSNGSDAATKNYVDNAVEGVEDSAPVVGAGPLDMRLNNISMLGSQTIGVMPQIRITLI